MISYSAFIKLSAMDISFYIVFYHIFTIKKHSFYICNTGNNFIHVSGLHILNGISIQN